MRRVWWIAAGAGLLLVLAGILASMRPPPGDAFANYRQFIKSDVTTIYQANPKIGLPRKTRYRSIYIDSKDPDEVFRIAHEVAANRRWSIWRGLRGKDDFYACDGELLDPNAELQATRDPLYTNGHTAVIHDSKQVSTFEDWGLRLKNGGRDPAVPFH